MRASVQDRGLVVEGPKDGTAKDTLVQQARYYATRSRKQRGIKMGWDRPKKIESEECVLVCPVHSKQESGSRFVHSASRVHIWRFYYAGAQGI